MREKWVVRRRRSRLWVFPLRREPGLLQCAAPPRPEWLRETEPAAQAAGSLRTETDPPGPEKGGSSWAGPGCPPRVTLTAPASLRVTYPRGHLWSPAFLPTWFAARAAAGWLQRPRGLPDPSARTAKAPRVRPGLARAERAGPRSASLNAHQLWSRVASALAPGPAGPRSPGHAEVPPPGPYDGDLLGEKG